MTRPFKIPLWLECARRLLDVTFSPPSSIGLVFEHMEADLGQLLHSPPPDERGLESPVALSLLYQVLAGICHTHACSLMHRDLKPQNVLVNPDGRLKIADLGLARVYGTLGRPYTAEVVTVWYRAPELLLGCHHYSPAIDLWSIGCMFYEMREGKPLFRGTSDWHQLLLIFQ